MTALLKWPAVFFTLLTMTLVATTVYMALIHQQHFEDLQTRCECDAVVIEREGVTYHIYASEEQHANRN